MGLDVTAYSKLRKIDCVFNAEGAPIDPQTKEPLDYDNYVLPYHNPDFPGRADDIEDKACYGFADSTYVTCGAYSRYFRWRDNLAQLAGYPLGHYEQYGQEYDSYCVACWNGETGPFSELINFSDCEGTIGSAVAKKLCADFAAHQEQADAHADEYFRRKYGEWRAAFELAADGGCVQFH